MLNDVLVAFPGLCDCNIHTHIWHPGNIGAIAHEVQESYAEQASFGVIEAYLICSARMASHAKGTATQLTALHNVGHQVAPRHYYFDRFD